MKVLIVEDSDTIREILTRLLSEIPGVEIVGEAADAMEAIEKVEDLRPDVVTLDIRIPGGSGIGVLRQIKETHPSIKVVMLTNYPFLQHRKACEDAGADGFFDKSKDFFKVSDVLWEMNSQGI